MSASRSKKKFKVKLESGRVLGPLDLGRIRKFVDRGKITGDEVAKEHPNGEWKPIHQYDEINEIFLKSLKGVPSTEVIDNPEDAPSVEIPEGSALEATAVLTEDPEEEPVSLKVPDGDEPEEEESTDAEFEATMIEPTVVDSEESIDLKLDTQDDLDISSAGDLVELDSDAGIPKVSDQETILFQKGKTEGPIGPTAKGLKKLGRKDLIRVIVLSSLLGYFGYEAFWQEAPKKDRVKREQIVQPTLPVFSKDNADPIKSKKLTGEGIKFYIRDTVPAYKKAAEYFYAAARLDIKNVQALGLLASSYLNLIDSSNRDQNYFEVVTKLIELANAENNMIPQVVIADSEFQLVVKRFESAKNRIIEYTRSTADYEIEMFYYLAHIYFEMGSFAEAEKILARIPDDQTFSPKVFYLRGQILEKLERRAEAYEEYRKATIRNTNHARSRVRMGQIKFVEGDFNSAAKHMNKVFEQQAYLGPTDLAHAFYLRGMLHKSQGRVDAALGDLERAVRRKPTESLYRVELYGMRYEAGDNDPKIKKQARMFYFLGQGESFANQGEWEEAKIAFLKAREEDRNAVLPLVRIGDMLVKTFDVLGASDNYKKAIQLQPKNGVIWGKYVSSLIESYEWDAARKAIQQFRKIPNSRSRVEKLVGDLYLKQGRAFEALPFYQKALVRQNASPSLYVSYADALFALKKYKEAPFFYALGRRLDPLNWRAISGTARSIAESQSIDEGLEFLESEARRFNQKRPEIISAQAELLLKKGERELALKKADEAIRIDPQVADPYWIKAKIQQEREQDDKMALTRAIYAFKDYSDRKLSDPRGYLERYRIFVRLLQFDEATAELDKIHALFPKFPNLHFYRGKLFAQMGNQKVAVEEYQIELKNNPNNVEAMVALGRIYLDGRAYNEALKQFSRAMRIAPQAPDPKRWAGWANFLLQNYQGAVALLESAASLDEGNPFIYRQLGDAYEKLGLFAKSRNALRRYLELAPDAPDRDQVRRRI